MRALGTRAKGRLTPVINLLRGFICLLRKPSRTLHGCSGPIPRQFHAPFIFWMERRSYGVRYLEIRLPFPGNGGKDCAMESLRNGSWGVDGRECLWHLTRFYLSIGSKQRGAARLPQGMRKHPWRNLSRDAEAKKGCESVLRRSQAVSRLKAKLPLPTLSQAPLDASLRCGPVGTSRGGAHGNVTSGPPDRVGMPAGLRCETTCSTSSTPSAICHGRNFEISRETYADEAG